MTQSKRLLSLLSLLTCTTIVHAADQYISNESEDGVGGPFRINIPPFLLELYPTNSDFASPQEELVEDTANVILKEYLKTQVPDGTIVDYVSLINVVNNQPHRSLQEKETTVLEIGGGLASFRGDSELSISQVNTWVSDALEGPLLESLQLEASLNELQSITFTSLSPAPTASPSKQRSFVGGIEDGNMQIAASGDSSGVIAASAVGVIGLVGIVAAAMLMSRRRKRAKFAQEPVFVKKSEAVMVVEDDFDYSEDEESLQTNQRQSSEVSVAESESEWTLSSNATDAFTVKSGGRTFPRASHSILQTESFERDRQVSLKKDMMQAPWSTAIPVITVEKGNQTVLKPSHFSVGARVNSYDMDEHWNPDDTSSDNQDTASPFLFEAQGEEVVLMPPSRTRSTRPSFEKS